MGRNDIPYSGYEIVVDNFAGGGGASSGIEAALGRPVDIAINHDPEAIALHRANHPATRHLCDSVWDVSPRDLVAGRQMGLGWFSPDCFPAGTLILTTCGYQAIEEVEVGQFVLTHNGRYRPVTATMTSQRQLVIVRGQGHPGISVSPEHPFYARAACNVWNNLDRSYTRTLGEPQWIKAAELRTVGAPTNAAGGDLSFWATPTKFPELPIPEVLGRGMTSDARLMWLAGRYVGDGWTRLSDTRAELVITCGKSEVESLRETLSVWTRRGHRSGRDELAWTERDTATAHQFATNHRGLVAWLREQFGHGAGVKSFPAWSLGMNESLRRSLLAGYVSADGHTRTICNGEVTYCSTISKSLAFSLRSLAESLGYTTNVNGPYENRTCIEGRTINALPLWGVKWRHVAQREQNVRDELHNWTRLRCVEDEERTATVYNIAVEEDESYVAEGIVVHNCTFHSKARGGKPFRERDPARRRRGLAWIVVPWIKAARPRVIMLENVEEFADWGPLLEDGRPCPIRRGLTFRRWHRQIENLGYQIDMRELRACDYGAPTIRKRLFVIARRDGDDIVFPEASHGPFTGALPYRTAADCIDWSLPCPSIFTRPKPLADATLRRIARGVMRYVVNNPRPFIVPITHTGSDRVNSIDEPLRTVTTAQRGEFALISPFMAAASGPTYAQKPRSIEAPVNAITTDTRVGVVAAFLAKHYGGNYTGPGVAMDQPLATITTVDHHALVHAFLVKYYSTDQDPRIDEPMHTVTTKERFGLVMVRGEPHYIVDIGMRMLAPRELYRAQSFRPDYIIDHGVDEHGHRVSLTKTAQVRMCGNSVPPVMAEALVRANCVDHEVRSEVA